MSNNFSPLRYPGGKNCIFPFVSRLMHENGLTGCKYIEPYAGGAGLALRLLYEEHVDSIVINDLDPLVHAFWRTCTRNPEAIIRWIERTPITISKWRECREIARHRKSASELELACSFFFLNRTNVSGVLRGGVIGGLSQKGSYKIDARFNKTELIKKIEKISGYSGRIEVSKLDGIKLIERFRKQTEGVFIYLDPPYFEKGSNLYLNAYNQNDHIELAKFVKTLSTPWLLSYDNHSFIINLYPEYKKRAYRLQHSTSNKTGTEVLVFPDSIAFESSIHLLTDPIAV